MCLMLTSTCWHSQCLICRQCGLAFVNSKSVRFQIVGLLHLFKVEERTCQTDILSLLCLCTLVFLTGYCMMARPHSRCLISWYLFHLSLPSLAGRILYCSMFSACILSTYNIVATSVSQLQHLVQVGLGLHVYVNCCLRLQVELRVE